MSENIKEVLQEFRVGHCEDLIPCMQRIQDREGYISEDSVIKLGEYFGLPPARVFGIATFYDYFKFSPVEGDIIMICNGTSCHMAGSEKLLKEAEKIVKQANQKSHIRLNIRLCGCQGSCNAGPVMQVNDLIITRANPDEVKHYINKGSVTGKGAGNE